MTSQETPRPLLPPWEETRKKVCEAALEAKLLNTRIQGMVQKHREARRATLQAEKERESHE